MALYDWFVRFRESGGSVTTETLTSKYQELYNGTKYASLEPNYKVSKGMISRFKERFELKIKRDMERKRRTKKEKFYETNPFAVRFWSAPELSFFVFSFFFSKFSNFYI